MFNPVPKPEKTQKKRSANGKSALSKIVKELDTWFSRRVRLEETIEGYVGKCIDCGQRIDIRRADLGHYHSRKYNATRWERSNVGLQKKRCNMLMGDPTVHEGFKSQLIFRYGSDRFERLAIQKNNYMKLDRVFLQILIEQEKKMVHDLLMSKGLQRWW